MTDTGQVEIARVRPSHETRLDGLCAECGRSFASIQPSNFCCTACRSAWNNRRQQRGAELYDLFMAYRFDRQTARALNIQSAMNRLASLFRADDRKMRAGRMSWVPPHMILKRRPYLLVREGRQ